MIHSWIFAINLSIWGKTKYESDAKNDHWGKCEGSTHSPEGSTHSPEGSTHSPDQAKIPEIFVNFR